jgi:hypothetical protein
MPPTLTPEEVIAAMGARGGGALDLSHIIPPDGFQQIDRNGFYATTAGDVANTSALLETIQLPPSMEGWIRTIGLECTDFSQLQLQLNQANWPMRDYNNIQVPLGSTSVPKATFIKIPPNQPITLQAVNILSESVGIRWSLWGWFYIPAKGR